MPYRIDVFRERDGLYIFRSVNVYTVCGSAVAMSYRIDVFRERDGLNICRSVNLDTAAPCKRLTGSMFLDDGRTIQGSVNLDTVAASN